jgi:3-oxoacyl-[acyl-carrier-protein] synthase III
MIREYNSQLQFVNTGISRGSIEVSNDELAELEWTKYKSSGESDGEKKKTTAEDIYNRLGVRTRPIASSDQTHASMFNEALDDAFTRAEENGVSDIRGNIQVLFASSTNELRKMPSFLEDVTEHAELHPNQYREFISQACTGFANGVNRLSRYVEENPGVEGYGVVGASEIIGPLWRDDNFDKALFGDLACVAILKFAPGPVLASERGIVGNVDLHTPDIKGKIIRRDDGLLYMDGRAVQKLAPRAMVDLCRKSLDGAGLGLRDIDKFAFHPGSKHVFSSTIKGMARFYADGFVESTMPVYIEDSGNNGAASNPNALHRMITEGEIKRDSLVYVGAIGMGFYESGFIIRDFPFLLNQ